MSREAPRSDCLSDQYSNDARLGPLGDLSTVTIAKAAGENQNQIDEPPNPEPANCHQLENPGPDLPHIEAMRPEHAKEEAQQERGKDALVRQARVGDRRLWGAAARAHEGSRFDDVAAVRADLYPMSDGSCHGRSKLEWLVRGNVGKVKRRRGATEAADVAGRVQMRAPMAK